MTDLQMALLIAAAAAILLGYLELCDRVRG
jgi:hypothetical protein